MEDLAAAAMSSPPPISSDSSFQAAILSPSPSLAISSLPGTVRLGGQKPLSAPTAMASASSINLVIVQIQSHSTPLHQPSSSVSLASGLYPIDAPTPDWFDLPKPPDVMKADFPLVGSIGGKLTPQRNCIPIGTISIFWKLNGSQVPNDLQEHSENKGKRGPKPETGPTSKLHSMGLSGKDDQAQDTTGSVHKSCCVESQVAHFFEPFVQE